MRRAWIAVAVLGLGAVAALTTLVVLWVNAAQPSVPEPEQSVDPGRVTTAPMEPSAPPAESEPSEDDGHSDDGDESHGHQPADLDDAERAEVEKFAADTMKLFARPPAGTSEKAWWKALEGRFTPDARDEYQWVDPQNVPFTKVTGPGTVVDGSGDHMTVDVRVPTDGGEFIVIVQLVFPGINDTPQVVALVFPEDDDVEPGGAAPDDRDED